MRLKPGTRRIRCVCYVAIYNDLINRCLEEEALKYLTTCREVLKISCSPIKLCIQLPAEALVTFPCRSHIFLERGLGK